MLAKEADGVGTSESFVHVDCICISDDGVSHQTGCCRLRRIAKSFASRQFDVYSRDLSTRCGHDSELELTANGTHFDRRAEGYAQLV
jgi:hypothetical protein